MDDSRPRRPASEANIVGDETIPAQRAGNWQLPEIAPDADDDATLPATRRGNPPHAGFSRRKLLVGAGAGALAMGTLGTGAAVYLSRQSATSTSLDWTRDEARIGHLLRRAGFGATFAELQTYGRLGVSGALDKLLAFSSTSNAALDARLQSLHLDFSQAQNPVRWVVLRMIYSQRPLEEKMTLFWHGVLTSSLAKIGGKANRQLLIQQNTLLRAKSMGRFDDLVRAITTDPAMLYWLDGRLSSGRSPNENYSRELMELFTMGIGNYTQDDVHQGALALTGWVVRGGQSHFIPGRHYDGSVTFLGHSGPMTVDDVVRIVCAHPATGLHIARRMWRFFVYDNPSQADLQPLADAYYSHDHSIAAMVRAMFTSPQFFSAEAYRARVKSPLEFLAGAIRALGLETNGTGLPGALTAMGQVPLDPPNVAGWPGDGVSPAWMSTQTWITRINLADALAAASATTKRPRATALNLTSPSGQAAIQHAITQQQLASADDLVRYYVTVLLDNALDADRRAVLTDALTNSPIKGGPTFTLAGGKKVSVAATAEMLYLLLSLPEYQMN